jgi:hypothetical protein
MAYTGPRKLYIDSRYRSSGTHSDFTFQLSQSVEVPHGWIAIVDNIQIPNVFLTCDGSRNRLYLRLSNSDQPDQDRTLTLADGMYNGITLAIELQTQLNALGVGSFTVAYGTGTGQLSIGVTDAAFAVIRVLGRSVNRPYDALDTIGAELVNGHAMFSGGTVVFPGHVDVAGTRVLYLTSPNIGHYNSLGPRGESDILRAIYVDQPNGSYISSQILNPWEHIDVGGQQLQSLRFRLVDGNGRVVDMRGRSIAFSILLMNK